MLWAMGEDPESSTNLQNAALATLAGSIRGVEA